MQYSPGMFSRTEAAQLLRALQVREDQALASYASEHMVIWGDCLRYCELRSFASRSKKQDVMQDEVAWQQKEVTVHGKTVMQPRLVAYMGDDPSLAYTYSRQTMFPVAWTPAVSMIKVITCLPDMITTLMHVSHQSVGRRNSCSSLTCRKSCRLDWSRRRGVSSTHVCSISIATAETT